MFGPGELEQIKTDEVKATWGMEDQIILNGTGGLVEMRGGGYYYETWKTHNDDWFLASLRLERTYQKISLTAKVFMFLERYSGLTFV